MSIIPQAFAETATSSTVASTAGAAQSPQGGAMGTIIMLGLFFVFFYLFLFRPQSKRAKEHRAMLAKLAVGDEVITSGGLLGVIVKMDENFTEVQIAEGVNIKVQRSAISSSVPKGTFKSA